MRMFNIPMSETDIILAMAALRGMGQQELQECDREQIMLLEDKIGKVVQMQIKKE